MKFSKTVVIIAVLSVLVLAGGGLFLFSQHKAGDKLPGPVSVTKETIDLEAAKYLPENSLSFESVNTTVEDFDKWWEYYAQMAPYDVALPKKIKSGKNIESLAYAKFLPVAPGVDGQPWLTSMLVVVPKEDALLEVADEIQTADGFNGHVILSDDAKAFAIVDGVGFNSAEAIMHEGAKTYDIPSEVAKFANDHNVVKYMDMRATLDTLISYNPAKKETLTNLLSTTLGMSGDVRVLMSSDDAGKTWEGELLTGTVDVEKADPAKADEALFNAMGDTVGEPPLLYMDAMGTFSASKGGETNKYGEIWDVYSPNNVMLSADSTEHDSALQFVYSPAMVEMLSNGEISPTHSRLMRWDFYEDGTIELRPEFYDDTEE